VRYKQFGKSGVSVSEVAIGTWGVGGRGWGTSEKQDSITAMRTMLDLGVNLIDTAPAYGDGYAETVVGETIQGRRDKVFISTKCGIKIDAPRGSNRKIATGDEVISGCEGSLRRLGTDYIDILFVHWPDEHTPIEETMGALNTLKEQGKIRHIGLSNFSIAQIEAAGAYGTVEIIQPPFSLVEQKALEIMRWCHEKGISSMTYASLGAGILGGKIRSLPQFEQGDVRNGFYDYFREPKFSKVMELLKVMDGIAEAHKVPLSQIALNWAVQKDFVLTALVGVRTTEHARENAGAGDWTLSAEEIARLDAETGRLFGA
jgi:aryl-alcohol dehydrogenase-like predicted oxidoreductase